MYPLLTDSNSTLVQQHIDDLRREADLHRLVRRTRRLKVQRRHSPRVPLQRAPSAG